MDIDCPVCRVPFESHARPSVPYRVGAPLAREIVLPEAIYFCPRCAVGVAHPVPSNQWLDEYYERGDYWNNTRVKVFRPHQYPGLFAQAQARWDFIESSCGWGKGRPVSVLDIGAGHGFIGMAAARSRRVKLEKFGAVEKDKAFRASLAKTWQKCYSNIPIQAEEHLDKVEGRYNVVVLSHVLEHLNDPLRLLADALRFLDHDGVMFVEVPNQDFRFKEDFFPHILFFNASSMTQLLESTGLAVSSSGVFGHNADESPMHYRNAQSPVVAGAGFFYKFRYLIPSFCSVPFFLWYYGARQCHPQGTWLRILASKHIT